MLKSETDDRERQQDEVLALSYIFDTIEFSYNENDTIHCSCNVFLSIPNGSLGITNMYVNDEQSLTSSSFYKCSIQHLPPVRLYMVLPDDYPSKNPPKFNLTISWIPPWETSFVCQKLDEIWKENEGNEVLFLWLEFLKNDLFTFLGIKDTLDVSLMYMVHTHPQDYVLLNLTLLCDSRAKNCALFLNPIQFLVNYSTDQHKVDFERKFYECCICFEEYSGQKCIELENCHHIYCRDCVQQYIALKIKEGIGSILCPYPNCAHEVTLNEVKDLCPNLFAKYDEIMLRVSLSTMRDIVFCPRISCQYPALRDFEDTLAICGKCSYCFCSYCLKVYHGVTSCSMTANETLKLIKDYQIGNRHRKQQLEQKYGKKQIQIVVEKHLTKEYLKENAKPCPNCQTLTAKISGCNKMVCTHCQAAFCWLCGIHITTQNGYDHFMIDRTACYGRLLEGVNDDDVNDLDELEIQENMLWFN